MKRIIDRWTLEEAEEDFKRLPGEPLAEFLEERDRYLRDLEAFGPAMPRPPSVAWEMVQGQRRPPPAPPRQLKLPLDGPMPSP